MTKGGERRRGEDSRGEEGIRGETEVEEERRQVANSEIKRRGGENRI